ncbi:3'-5' exonuclease [Aquibacillus rhizosphaerae]|uniref:3'-5' exonuclease n=1 Tax=Aquibacillus rhizosphaerae TaxID=3051431 RepID=A0ABT7LCI4_9BACI|nr:3'-5' exonuclease [Aquibacillus sp. LR5S19]MDL4842271.1 3'-5' exonuclease [Aquibacillus sp. LR5S19]
MTLVSIDFETANRYRFSPCAIGIVTANEQGVVDEFYSLINPLTDFESHNIFVHGITERDVVDAPTFEELWPTIEPYLKNNIIIAHNASFDMSVLRASLDRFELTYPELEYLCSVQISKQAWPGLPNYKLNSLADFIGFQFEHHHALEDSRVVVHLLLKAMRDHNVSDLRELIALLQISCGRVFERNYITPKLKRTKQKKMRT